MCRYIKENGYEQNIVYTDAEDKSEDETEARSQPRFANLMVKEIKACEWLVDNHCLLKMNPRPPTFLTIQNDSFLQEMENFFCYHERPVPDEAAEIDPEFIIGWQENKINEL